MLTDTRRAGTSGGQCGSDPLVDSIVILGAGQAGAQAAASLRQEKFSGRIILVGEESAPPYQRPPLSKGYLKGELDEERLHLRPTEFYGAESVELRLGVRVCEIDRSKRRVRLSNDDEIPYDALLLATGAPPRRLKAPGADLEGVHYLRTLRDSDALRGALRSAAPLVIVGAGYVGLEVAAVARSAGLAVTVVEAADRPLARVADAKTSRHFTDLHKAHGVCFRFGETVNGFEGSKRVEAAALRSGERIACGSVLIGIGATPAIELAAAAGLAIEDGIAVDEHMQTSDEAIYAAGDVANFPSRLYGRRMRIESVPSAIEQAKTAAANMAGRRIAHDSVPWFWSDQYDCKLQTAGIFAGADETVVRGGQDRLSVWSLLNGRLLAVDAMNDPQAFVVGKRLIAAKCTLNAKTLADPGLELKSLIR